MCFQAIDKFHGTVMLDLETFGKDADSGIRGGRQTFDSQERLILLWLNARSSGSLFAEILEAAHLVAKFGERAVIEAPFCGSLQASRIIS